jgi:acetyl/propionyl-CoA carboxylase alpha subunit
MKDYKQSKEYKEAKEQNDSKNRLSAEMQQKLDELLKKSPMEIKHDEIMFVLENMNLESITAAAMERQNLQTRKGSEEN